MKTENLSTLKIHKLTQAQYNREAEAGTLEETAIYLTPDEEKASANHTHDNIQSGLGGQVALYFDDVTNKNHFFKPHINYPTTQEINLGSINTRTWDKVYAGTGVYVNGTACSLEGHTHAASAITSGTLSSNRLPTVPITKGGTGATTAAGALTNLGITATAAELNKLDGVTATTTELNYVDGVTSNIQTQLNGKAASSHTHWYLSPNGSGSNTVMMTSGGNLYPYADVSQQLGTTARRWSVVLCKTLDESSDERIKENFSADMDKYVAMLDLLEPTSYHFKSEADKEDRKRNIGYVAQRVQDAMAEVGLEDTDFGGLRYDKEGESKGEYTYGLAYSQFIPILHAKIKQLEEKYNAKIEEYDMKIAELNEKLEALTA